MKKLLHFVNPVYNVNILQSENGSVSASPISGSYGTEVTLTNTPDEGYVFDKYELTGATLYDGNKFKIKKSDVNVQGYFKIPMVLWVNDSTEYVAQGGSTRQRNVSFASYIPSTSDMNYITWILDCYLTGGSGGAARINYLVNGGSSGYWNMYAHFNRSLPSFISMGTASSNWHTDPDATSYIQIIDNVYVNTTLWPKATYKTFKYVFDRTNHRTYFYCEGIYLGYTDILTEDAIKFNYVTLYSDQNRSYEIAKIKNVKVAGFSTLSDARNWDGSVS